MPDENQPPDQITVDILREISIQMQKDPVMRQRAMKILAGDAKQDVIRAVLWSKATNVPYYKEHFAREIQPYLDKMIVDRKPLEWQYASFPRMRKSTLYHKIYQAFLWLCDCDANAPKYVQLKSETEISRAFKTGVRIIFTNQARNDSAAPVEVNENEQPDDRTPRWRSRIDEFLSNGEVGTVLHLTRLHLTDEDVLELNMQLGMLHGVMFRVTRDEVKIIKPTAEQLAKINGGGDVE